jgi:hypothetical protein
MKLFIVKFSQVSRHLIPLRYKYSPQHPVLKHPKSGLVFVAHPLYVSCKLISFVCQIFPLFVPEMACWLHVLYRSDYPQLFPLDPVAIAVCLVSFDLIFFSILPPIMPYASLNHNNLDSPC